MTEQEAFEDYIHLAPYDYQKTWAAACAWQREELAQHQIKKCEAGPSLQDLWDCWDAVHGGQKPEQEPVAFTRNGFRLEWNPYYQTSSIPPDSSLYLHPAPIPEGWMMVPKVIHPLETNENCDALLKLLKYPPSAMPFDDPLAYYAYWWAELLAAAPKPENA